MINAEYLLIAAKNTLRLEQESLDTNALGLHEIFLEAECSVISAGTELAGYTALDEGVYKKGNFNAYPWRNGYGLVGRIGATGSAISHLQTGQRVLSMASHASKQFYNIAPERQPYHNAYPIPEEIPADEAAVLRMALIALTAPRNSQLRLGDTVVILGLGLVGNLAAQLYQMAGARVIAIDPLNERCEYARKVGISEVLNLPSDEQIPMIKELTSGKGANIVVDAVGHSKIVETAVFAAADYGQIILLGSPRAAYQGDLTPILSRIHLGYLTMRGSLEWQNPAYRTTGSGHSIYENIQVLIHALQSGRLDFKTLISHRIKPQDAPETYAKLAQNPKDYMAVVIDWSSNSK